ncbi:MAG: CbiX/SirB N-terminal domain-containing protein [Gammaproteobacteria bacterium]|jgi:sirohydrochlorin ferrochelatase
MKALLLVAHGSRREASNEEIRELTRRLAGKADDAFGYIDCAFLELAEPSIPDGIQRCIDAGAAQVTVLPYFLSAGRHVAEDIPAEVRVKQEERPDVDIRIADYLGGSAEIPTLLLQTALGA